MLYTLFDTLHALMLPIIIIVCRSLIGLVGAALLYSLLLYKQEETNLQSAFKNKIEDWWLHLEEVVRKSTTALLVRVIHAGAKGACSAYDTIYGKSLISPRFAIASSVLSISAIRWGGKGSGSGPGELALGSGWDPALWALFLAWVIGSALALVIVVISGTSNERRFAGVAVWLALVGTTTVIAFQGNTNRMWPRPMAPTDFAIWLTLMSYILHIIYSSTSNQRTRFFELAPPMVLAGLVPIWLTASYRGYSFLSLTLAIAIISDMISVWTSRKLLEKATQTDSLGRIAVLMTLDGFVVLSLIATPFLLRLVDYEPLTSEYKFLTVIYQMNASTALPSIAYIFIAIVLLCHNGSWGIVLRSLNTLDRYQPLDAILRNRWKAASFGAALVMSSITWTAPCSFMSSYLPTWVKSICTNLENDELEPAPPSCVSLTIAPTYSSATLTRAMAYMRSISTASGVLSSRRWFYVT